MPIRITLTGDLGSGKSTVAKELHSAYGLSLFSTGAIQRGIAVEKGMTTFELNKYAETHPEIDARIDGELAALSDRDEDMAIDSRMGWHFVRGTFRVFLTADETVAAGRVAGDARGPAETYESIEDTILSLRGRKASENFRYAEKYGVDCFDMNNYDCVVDTTAITPEQAAAHIMAQYEAWQGGKESPRLWLSRYCLYPVASEGGGAASAGRIGAVLVGGRYFLYEGHDLAAARILGGEDLLPCALLAQDAGALPDGRSARDFVRGAFDLGAARAWAARCGFEFFSFPDV
ncbi:MAG: AAA family ATPase [Clostridiales Family XIII bacterium]|jgi:cytidylate kinase|nr:AAA family ATPase [Clostridiales Family XIII bacterium]